MINVELGFIEVIWPLLCIISEIHPIRVHAYCKKVLTFEKNHMCVCNNFSHARICRCGRILSNSRSCTFYINRLFWINANLILKGGR